MAVAGETMTSAIPGGEGAEVVLSARDVTVAFGTKVILDKLSLEARRGEILGFVGASGAGKSVLLRTILGLTKKQSGSITLFGVDVDKASDVERLRIDMRLGVLFQHGALFSALTVQENVQVPMREYLDLPRKLMDELALLKIELVGLSPDDAGKFPSELSGGMVKRAALARALALEPELLLLDEPTAGLDPDRSAAFVRLIRSLHHELGLTVVLVTHDVDTLAALATRIAVLAERRIVSFGTLEETLAQDHPFIQRFFLGEHGRNALARHGGNH